MASQRARQLVTEVYAEFVADKTALATLVNSATPLPAFAQELAAASGKASEALGANDAAVKETKSWLERVDHDEVGKDLKSLDSHLQSRTFLVSNRPTAADLSVFASLHSVVSTLPRSEQHAHPSLVRYFSHMSHQSAVAAAGARLQPPLSAIEPEYEGFPKIERKKPEDLKKEKAKEKAAAAGVAVGPNGKAEAAAAAKEQVANSAEGEQKQGKKKEKKERAPKEGAAAAEGGKKGKGGGNGGGGAAAESAVPLPSMIDLRVGHIVDIKKHPDADSLYLETIDFGEPEPRIVLSGLVNFVPIEEMKDRWVVGICNLKPQAMRGIKSHAMLLCATHKDGKEHGVEPISPPAGSTPGERIYVEGYEGREPEPQLNPKKKIFEAIQPNYTTTEAKEAAWLGPLPGGPEEERKPRIIRTAKGPCFAPNFVGASLS